MRKIKFRAWDGKNMYYPCDNSGIALDYCKISGWNIYENKSKPNYLWLAGESLTEDFILMQYIGINDSQNKEIYEGDVVIIVAKVLNDGSFGNSFRERYCIRANVIYNASAFRFDSGFEMSLAHSSCKIIGNIYEKPELLKEGL